MTGGRVGYLLFATGTLLGIWLAWRAWVPQSDNNPLVALVLVWTVAGLAHIFVRTYWRACRFAAVGSALGYFVLAMVLMPNPFMNEMFGAGVIELGLIGFVFSMAMGVPVVIYRRRQRSPAE